MHDFDLLSLISTKTHLLDPSHVSSVKAGYWEKDGVLHHHSPEFFQHHQIGDFHEVGLGTDLSIPSPALRVIDLDI